MTLLLTGFGPFGTMSLNPSQAVIRALASRGPDPDLTLAVLPTAYVDAASKIHDLLTVDPPDVCLLLGVAEGTDELRVENVARNVASSSEPDVRGDVWAGGAVVPDGPPEYRSTLPVRLLVERLSEAGLPVRSSDDAGTYVCNHVFYVACHTAATAAQPIRCGFLHLPDSWPVGRLLRGLEVCLDLLVRQFSSWR